MEIFKNTVYQHSGSPAKTTMSGISETKVGSPLEYGGDPDTLNPEEMLVASVNSCIMLVFYHFADKYKVDIASYHSDAEGKVEKTKNGLRFTHIEVKAKVRLCPDSSPEKIEQITQLAEKYCLVSGSLAFPVEYTVELAE